MWDFLGNLASAGINYITGSQNRSAQEQANEQANRNHQQNIALQREFAQNGIQWKVADAQAAGLHPLAALGASTTSFAPVSVGGGAATSDFGSMGQDIGRAVKAAMSDSDREEQTRREGQKLALEKAGLENEVLRTELASKQKRMETNVGAVAMPANTSVLGRVPLPRPFPGERTVSTGEAVKGDDLKQKGEDFPQTKIVRPFGYPLKANPWFSDGQQFEDRYGESEIGSTIKFGVNTIADHAYTGYHMLPSMQEAIDWAGSGRRARRARVRR